MKRLTSSARRLLGNGLFDQRDGSGRAGIDNGARPFARAIYAAEANSAEAVKWLRETVATGFGAFPLFERDALLDKIRKAPEYVQFMNESKATVDGYRREFERR